MSEVSIEENELVMVAMEIILNAGDARIKVNEALEFTKEFKFEEAKGVLNEAKEYIRLAHVAQTEVIQGETRGKHFRPSVLFNHAQDTLMTIMTECNMALQMIELTEAIINK